MTAAMWDAIEKAYHFVLAGSAARVDGDGWKVYRAGTIIRIDLEVQA